MSIPIDKELYEFVKLLADKTYETHGAYKSGFIVRKYKQLGGRYKDTNNEKTLKRWFDEIWTDVGNKEYPVYRPTIRINDKTPLTIDEIDEDNLKEQIKLKQKYKNKRNLPKFKSKYIKIEDIPENHKIFDYSNPHKLRDIADSKGYLEDDIYLSDKPGKKYMLFHPETNKKIYFGMYGYEDYLKHNDEKRRKRFLNRNKKWANFDKYTPAKLSFLLW